MEMMFKAMCTLWACAGCLLGLIVIVALLKGALDLFTELMK